MINIGIALLIILIHFFSDFVCQTHNMAVNKSKSNYWLSMHVLAYTALTFVFWHFLLLQPSHLYSLFNYVEIISFIFTTHWITDYITSRMSSKYFGKGDYHNGFVVVGGDQVLHYTQLFLAYYYFIR